MHYERVMVFGAHPDDELRMAAAIAKLSAAGTAVTVAICTDGCEGYPRLDMRDTIVATRARESDEVQKILGVQRYVNLGAPDMGLVNNKISASMGRLNDGVLFHKTFALLASYDNRPVGFFLGLGQETVPLGQDLLGFPDLLRNRGPHLVDQVQNAVLIHDYIVCERQWSTFIEQFFETVNEM